LGPNRFWNGWRTIIHQLEKWPAFYWDMEALVRHRQGLLSGRMSGLGFELRAEAKVETLVCDLVKSSAIEGEALDISMVRSSLGQRLGLETGGKAASRQVDGLVEMMLVMRRWSKARKAAWILQPGWSGSSLVWVGRWKGPGKFWRRCCAKRNYGKRWSGVSLTNANGW
jgi:hypothetical protein